MLNGSQQTGGETQAHLQFDVNRPKQNIAET